MNNIIKLSALLLIVCLGSCIEPLDIDFRGNRFQRIVVNGELEIGDEETRMIVKLSNLDGFSTSLQILQNAEVKIYDSSNNSIDLERTFQATYDNTVPTSQPGGINFAVGESYILEVRLNDGTTYRSALETALDVPEIEQIDFRIKNGSFGPVADYTVVSTTTANGVKNRLKWDVERAFKLTDCLEQVCYFADLQGVQNALITTPGEASQERVQFELNDVALGGLAVEGHYFVVRQKSLSAGAAEYWTQVNLSINRDGDMFEPVAGKTVSNIFNIDDPNELIEGYFHASKVEVKRIFISAEAQGFTEKFCPQFNQVGRKVPECNDCTLINGASLIRPIWYVD